MIVGVIADTHGLLRPEAVRALEGCSRIIHAGDVGPKMILEDLARIAPVTAVRGNVDREPWALRELPEEARLTVEGANVYVLHDRNALAFDPAAAGAGVVVTGHSHKPLIERVNGVLYVNPGSAGKRRFSLPITLAKLEFSPAGVEARLIGLLTAKPFHGKTKIACERSSQASV